MTAKWQRATVESKFHIDMDWWRESKRDIRVYMRELLCEGSRTEFEGYQDQEEIDWVDEQTGEVARVDWLGHSLRTCCSQKPSYITPNTPVIDAIFRTFLANDNKPLSVRELYELLDRRPPEMLLRMLTVGSIYMGIRPAR